jgi:hypothetical protein
VSAQPAGGEEQKPGLMQRGWDGIQQALAEDRKKWGGMTPGAMVRLGLAELREAFSLGGNIAQPTPLGMYGTLTPGEVGSARDNDPNVRQMEEEPLMNDNQRLPSPSEIADGKTAAAMHGGQQQAGKVHGETAQARAEGGMQGPEHGVYGPEHGVYGPEKGVYGHDNGAQGPQAADGARSGPLPSPGEIADGQGEQQGQQQGQQQSQTLDHTRGRGRGM